MQCGGSSVLKFQTLMLAALALLTACESHGLPAPAVPLADTRGTSVPPLRPGYLPGYLPNGTAPNSLTLLPPPPTPGSAAQARDDEAAKTAVAIHGSPRWNQAVLDADLNLPQAAETFSCAVGTQISERDTPRLYVLLRRTATDASLATYPTKNRYQRARPFTVNSAPICSPAEEDFLRSNGSYPSGHAAIGWAWALILAEAVPERADEILARGRAFGQSRVVCNVHWLSDVEEARVIGAATVAKLHSNAEFRADLEAARGEIEAARSKGLRPGRDCAKEAAQ